MQNGFHLRVFVAVLLLAALFAVAPAAWLLTGAALGLAIVVGLAAYIFLCSLPARVLPSEAAPSPAGFGPAGLPVVAALAVILIFALWPNLDLVVARWFQSAQHRFVARTQWGEFGRMIGYMVPFLTLAAFLLAYGANRWLGWRWRFAPTWRDVLFVGLSMLIGPALIINLGMKNHLHRPRPSQIVEFGGAREYRPFYRFDGACPKNCSFPSGEASEAFWMLAPASLAPPLWRGAAMAGAVVFGALVGLLRMAFGGHFLSDVLIAAIIMWALLLVMRWLIYKDGWRGRHTTATSRR